MKPMSIYAALIPFLFGASMVMAQAAPKEDFKPSSYNQPGQQYPMVNSERYARFRVVAPAGPERHGEPGVGWPGRHQTHER